MIRHFGTLVLCALPFGLYAEGMDLSENERAVFGNEVRAALLANPEIVDRALNPPPPDVSGDAARQDLDRLRAEASVFAPTARGIGSETPRVTMVFFEDYPCADCATAWAEAKALVEDVPDLRIEPRFANDSAAAQLLLSVLDRQGPEAYHAARDVLLPAQTADALDAVIAEQTWVQDRMHRPQPAQEASAFKRLELQMVPSYALPDMMLQGAIPGVVLRKYVTP